MQIHPLSKHQDKITAVAKQSGITYLGLFGSYARGEQTPESDIDLLLIIEHNDNKIITKIKEFEKMYNKEIHFHQATKDKFQAGLKEKDPLVV